jgi:hypothetical protein
MTQNGTQSQPNATNDQTSIWSRAFEEVQRARDTGTTPDPEVFQDLTKSAGGD